MSSDSLYDDDILLWSEQQAAALRRLARAPNVVPNELDIENVAEEIESVGRSELAAVKSYVRQILLHLIKLATEPNSESVRHWRAEIEGFHAGMRDRYAPSMRQRIDMDDLWASAREQSLLAATADRHAGIAALGVRAPFTIDDLLGGRLDSVALESRLSQPQP